MVSVFAPVNIALIKYMGKENGLPTNASFSMTLDEIGTKTSMRILDEEGPLHFVWSPKGYVPPTVGQQKAEQFLKNPKIWKDAIESLGYAYHAPHGMIEIETENSVPAGTGIATSASGFAALALAWMGILLKDDSKKWKRRFLEESETKKVLATLSGFGSGSACRSFEGPFVEWDPRSGTKAFSSGKIAFTDFILLLDQKEKGVSSSEAHARVRSSPKFSGRVGRAHARLAQMKEALKRGDLEFLSKAVLGEALDMHELFHTSEPPFSYLNESSLSWIQRFRERKETFPSPNPVVTLDAGANIHVLVPVDEERSWERFFKTQEQLQFVKSRAGKGAHYVDSENI